MVWTAGDLRRRFVAVDRRRSCTATKRRLRPPAVQTCLPSTSHAQRCVATSGEDSNVRRPAAEELFRRCVIAHHVALVQPLFRRQRDLGVFHDWDAVVVREVPVRAAVLVRLLPGLTDDFRIRRSVWASARMRCSCARASLASSYVPALSMTTRSAADGSARGCGDGEASSSIRSRCEKPVPGMPAFRKAPREPTLTLSAFPPIVVDTPRFETLILTPGRSLNDLRYRQPIPCS
jgi:hypothetical protein